MPTVSVLIPVLSRPRNVGPLIASLADSLAPEDEVSELFLCSPGDTKEIAEIEARGLAHLVVGWEPGPGDYARKINAGTRQSDTDWFFTAADDLRFHPGWLRACLNMHIRTGALVIGTNDLANPSVMRGQTATHSLVHRDYLDRAVIDKPGDLLCEAYSHNCVDAELTSVAKGRKTFAFARDAHVEHLHPTWRTAPVDATYLKGRKDHHADRALFHERQRLWARNAHRVARARPAPVARWPER